MVSVGGLAAIINVAFLLTVAVADRGLQLIIRNFAAARLRSHRRAPVVHDSDTWLPNLPRSVIKYHRHPAILLSILCTIFLIVSELVIELGVHVSNECGPKRFTADVISKGGISGSITPIEMGASAFFVQNLTFIENDKLDRLPAGLPRRLTGAECFSCMTPEEYPDILSGCKVRQDKVYRPGELRVGINNTMGAFGIVTYAFEETTAEKRRFTGQGDLTGNGKNRALFLFYMSSQGLIYFEYAHQEHISELRKKSATLVKEVVWDETKAPVQTYVIACSVNELLPKKFMFANAVFRTIQLENTAILASFNETSNRFAQIKEQDVYKAGLSAKVIDVDEAGETRGTFYAYISCGAYKLNFMLPMIVCLSLIIVLGLLSALYSPWDIIRRVPYNSRTWFRHSQDASKPVDSFSMSIEEYEQVDLWEGHEQFVTDEMILEELREAGEYRISLHARGSTGPSFEDHAVERDTPHTSTSIWTA